MNEEFGPDIVSVVDEDGKEHVFEELDRIETDEGRFVALLPCYEDAADMLNDSGELIILKVTEEDGETYLSQIEDDELFRKIGEEFEKRLSEYYDFDGADNGDFDIDDVDDEDFGTDEQFLYACYPALCGKYMTNTNPTNT